MNRAPFPLLLVPIGGGVAWLPELAAALEEHFPVAAQFAAPLAAPAGDGPCDADTLLDALALREGLPEPGWMLGVAEADLAAPGRPWVFGQAEVAGRRALIGTARLGTAAEGLPFLRRVTKEAVHELGHVAGLPHCPDTGCVMSASAAPADVDRKADRFCEPCAAALRNLLGGGVA